METEERADTGGREECGAVILVAGWLELVAVEPYHTGTLEPRKSLMVNN